MKGLHRQPDAWLIYACEHGLTDEVRWLLAYDDWDVTTRAHWAVDTAKRWNQQEVLQILMQDERIVNRITNKRPFVQRSLAQVRKEVEEFSAAQRAEWKRRDQIAESLPLPYANYTLADLK
jgi:hypothetical protein